MYCSSNSKRSLLYSMILAASLLTIASGMVRLSALAKNQDSELIVRLGSFSKAVDYAPYLVAKQKHLFESALKPLNATVSYQEFQTLPSINEAFASKKIDAVFEAEAPCIVGKAAGIDLKILGISAVLNLPILVQKDSSITKISDLRGKRIAVLAGTSAHYVLLKLLENAGLSKSDVSIVNMTPPDAKSAFDSKKVDAWSIWPPFLEQEELAGFGRTIPNTSGKIIVIMAARSDFVKDNPAIAEALTSVLKSTRQWVSSHPVESQKIVAQELKIPLPVIEKAWIKQDWKATIDDSLMKDIQNKADFLKSVGFVRNNVSANSLVLRSAFN